MDDKEIPESMRELFSELTPESVRKLKGMGYSQSAIARFYGVTRQAVSWVAIYYSLPKSPRQEILLHFPFVVPASMSQTSPYKRLRDHAEYVAAPRGDLLAEDKLKRLRTFYKKLRDENVVLEFDPNIPPIPGVSNKGGWRFVPREPRDEDFLIRVNEYADITEEGNDIWRFPPREP